MRTLRKNKQTLQYALYNQYSAVYATDDDGNVITDIVDGVETPRETGDLAPGYASPVTFKANIISAGGEAEARAYGIDLGSYTHKMETMRGELPITETSLIFCEKTPVYEDGALVPSSADFRVIRVAESLNNTVYLLRNVV